MSILKEKAKFVRQVSGEVTSFHKGFGDEELFFFSIDHQQRYHSDIPLDDGWIPCTRTGMETQAFYRELEIRYGATEIANPDPEFQPVET